MSPFIFGHAPAFDPTIPSAKAFCIGFTCIEDAIPRIAFDRQRTPSATLHFLREPSAHYAPLTSPPDRTIPILISTVERYAKSQTPIPGDDSLALIDIVTYPLYLSVIHGIRLSQGAPELFAINHNILIGALPLLPALTEGVFSIFHFEETPIDDAPTHNILLPRVTAHDDVSVLVRHIEESPIRTVFPSHKNPEMDDRYALPSRRAQDGDPHRLTARTP